MFFTYVVDCASWKGVLLFYTNIFLNLVHLSLQIQVRDVIRIHKHKNKIKNVVHLSRNIQFTSFTHK